MPTHKFIRIPARLNGFIRYGCDVTVVHATTYLVVFIKCYTYLRLNFGPLVNASDLHSCSAWFESRPGHRITSLRCLAVFLSAFRQMPSPSSLLALQLCVGLFSSGRFVTANFSEVGSLAQRPTWRITYYTSSVPYAPASIAPRVIGVRKPLLPDRPEVLEEEMPSYYLKLAHDGFLQHLF
jgi:hypothetical protein